MLMTRILTETRKTTLKKRFRCGGTGMFNIDNATVILSLSGTYALIAMLPGPNLLMVAKAGLETSPRNAFLAALGVSLGAGMVAYVAFSGMAPFASDARWQPLLGCGFAILLIWLGVRAMLRASRPSRKGGAAMPISGASCLRIGLLTAATNPVTLAFFLGMGASDTCGSAQCQPGSAFLAAFLVAILWFGGVALSFSHPRAALLYRRSMPMVDTVLGCLLLAYGGHILLAML